MAKLEWNSTLSVDNAQIDDQHKELIRIANGLLNAIAIGRGKRTLSNVLTKLREYTVYHFACEEQIMEDERYPYRGKHSNEHANLKRQVKDFQQQLFRQEEITYELVLSFLKSWLLEHILMDDRELAKFIQEKKNG